MINGQIIIICIVVLVLIFNNNHLLFAIIIGAFSWRCIRWYFLLCCLIIAYICSFTHLCRNLGHARLRREVWRRSVRAPIIRHHQCRWLLLLPLGVCIAICSCVKETILVGHAAHLCTGQVLVFDVLECLKVEVSISTTLFASISALQPPSSSSLPLGCHISFLVQILIIEQQLRRQWWTTRLWRGHECTSYGRLAGHMFVTSILSAFNTTILYHFIKLPFP